MLTLELLTHLDHAQPPTKVGRVVLKPGASQSDPRGLSHQIPQQQSHMEPPSKIQISSVAQESAVFNEDSVRGFHAINQEEKSAPKSVSVIVLKHSVGNASMDIVAGVLGDNSQPPTTAVEEVGVECLVDPTAIAIGGAGSIGSYQEGTVVMEDTVVDSNAGESLIEALSIVGYGDCTSVGSKPPTDTAGDTIHEGTALNGDISDVKQVQG